MLLIPCPHCGERDESEFDYGGRAVALPRLNATTDEWHQALHLGNNNEDCVDEYWYHYAGCECWIRLRRNLSNHDFIDATHAFSEATN
jgi:heterotetrameric sarcosine oxidase delta subunit